MNKTVLFALGLSALAASAASAQQISPVTDRTAAAACAPRDPAAALACLDRYLTPEVKADIRSATAETIIEQQIYVGLWMRNNWGMWNGSDLAQHYVANRVPQVERMSDRIIDAYWLKTKGCNYDWNNVSFTLQGMARARDGENPCSVTLADVNRANMQAAGGRAGRSGVAAAAAEAEAAEAAAEAEEALNPNQ